MVRRLSTEQIKKKPSRMHLCAPRCSLLLLLLFGFCTPDEFLGQCDSWTQYYQVNTWTYPHIFSTHYGSQPNSLVSSCGYIMNNVTSLYVGFLMMDFTGFFDVNPTPPVPFISPTHVFPNSNPPVAGYQDPVSSSSSLLFYNSRYFNFSSENGDLALRFTTVPPPQTCQSFCDKYLGCEVKKGFIFWVFPSLPTRNMIPARNFYKTPKDFNEVFGTNCSRIYWGMWHNCTGSCSATITHNDNTKFPAGSVIMWHVQYFFGPRDFYTINGGSPIQSTDTMTNVLKYGESATIVYTQSKKSYGEFEYKRALVIEMWIYYPVDNVPVQVVSGNSGRITYPKYGFGVDQKIIQSWTLYTPPMTQVLLWFDQFKFFSYSEAEFSVSIPSNASFTPMIFSPVWNTGPPLLVIPYQSIFQEIQLSLHSGHGGSGFVLSYAIGMDSFNSRFGSRIRTQFQSNSVVDASFFSKNIGENNTLTIYSRSIVNNEERYTIPPTHSWGDWNLVFTNELIGGTLVVYFGYDFSNFTTSGIATAANVDNQLSCDVRFMGSGILTTYYNGAFIYSPQVYVTDTLLVQVSHHCKSVPLHFINTEGIVSSKPNPVNVVGLPNSSFLMFTIEPVIMQGKIRKQPPFMTLWPGSRELHYDWPPNKPVIGFYGCTDNKFLMIGQSSALERDLVIAQINLTTNTTKIITRATFSSANFGNTFSVDSDCETMASAISPGQITMMKLVNNEYIISYDTRFAGINLPPNNSLILADFRGISVRRDTIISLYRNLVPSSNLIFDDSGDAADHNYYFISVFKKSDNLFKQDCFVARSQEDNVTFTTSANGNYAAIGFPTLGIIYVVDVNSIESGYPLFVKITQDGEDPLLGQQISFYGEQFLVSVGNTVRTFAVDNIFESMDNCKTITEGFINTYSLCETFLSNYPANLFPNRYVSNNILRLKGLGSRAHLALNERGMILVVNPFNFTVLSVGGVGKGSYEINVEKNFQGDFACPPGTFRPPHEMSTCIFCPVGYYQNQSMSENCLSCTNTSYCPIASVYPFTSDIVTTFNKIEPFSSESSLPVSAQVLPDIIAGFWVYPILIFWIVFAAVGIYLAFTRTDQINVDLKLKIKKLGVVEKKIRIDQHQGIAFKDPSVSYTLAFFARSVLVFVVIIWMIWYYSAYKQYHATDPNWIPTNGLRSQAFLPVFTASTTVNELLAILSTKKFSMNIILNGATGPLNPCQSISSALSRSSSTGCFFNQTLVCSSRPYIVPINLSHCSIVWDLEDNMNLQDLAEFNFTLGDAFTQNIIITIQMNGTDKEDFTNHDGIQDSKILLPSLTIDSITIPKSKNDSILFNLVRVYEIDMVIRSSENEQLFNEAKTDYTLQMIFRPLTPSVVDGTIPISDFMKSHVPNQVSVKFQKPFYYIFNSEKRATKISELLLSFVLVNITTIGVFEFLFLLKIIFRIIKRIRGTPDQKATKDAMRRISKSDLVGDTSTISNAGAVGLNVQ